MLLACNWSTMGDSFFVCHHLAALYAYGYVLVRLIVTMGPDCLDFSNSCTCWIFFLFGPIMCFVCPLF